LQTKARRGRGGAVSRRTGALFIWQPKERLRRIEAKVERGLFLSGN